MKLIFSLLAMSIASIVQGRDLVLLTYRSDDDFKRKVENIILEDLKIPSKYLSWLQMKNPCRKVGDPLLQLCLKNRQVKVIQARTDVLQRTIGKITNQDLGG